MGRYKGVGMPRAKKKKLEEARERYTKQVRWADAENNGQLANFEPEAHYQLLASRRLPTRLSRSCSKCGAQLGRHRGSQPSFQKMCSVQRVSSS